MAIWILKDGKREGPYEDGDVRELLYEGTYTDADAAVRDGDPVQRTLGELLGRHPSPAAPAAPLPPPLPVEPAPAPPPVPSAAPAISAVPAAPPALLPPPVMPVTVVDFQMPFGSMVIFMIKWALASIPALLILATIFAIFWTLILTAVTGVFSSLSH